MSKSNPGWKKVRKLFNDLHLWMGIGAGLVLFVVCLTGTIYTFRTEIEEWLEPDKYFVDIPEGAERMSSESLLARVQAEVADGKVSSLTIPADPRRSYTVNVATPGQRRGTNYLVDPYTGELLGGTDGVATEFFGAVFRLHRWLLMENRSVGGFIVGVATIIFVFLVLTGLVIWFPPRLKSWRQGLKVKWGGNWKRVNHDLHNALGFYASLLLLVMALTGLFWSFEWYRNGWYAMWGVENTRRAGGPQGGGGQRHGPGGDGPGKARAKATANKPDVKAMTLEQLLAIADNELPYRGNYRVSVPAPGADAVAIRKYKTGFFAHPAADELSLDPVSGKVIDKEVFAEKPLNERIGRSVKALHVGDVFGTFSKILYFIACLIGTSLPVTGTLIWFNKWRKKVHRNRRASVGRQEPVSV